MSANKSEPDRSDQRVYCTIDQLLFLKQQARLIKLDAHYRPGGLLAGRYRSNLRGQGMNFEELRGFRTGDSIRNIDWKASARSRQKVVKVFTEETDRPTAILVDQRSGMFFGSKERTKSVTAAEVAAMLSWMILDNGDRLGGVVFNNHQQYLQKPARASMTAVKLLQSICEFNQRLAPGSNRPKDEITLDSVLTQTGNYLTGNGTLILISDGDGLVDEHLSRLEHLAYRLNVLVFLITDPLEYSISGIDRMVVSDGARQIELTADEQARQKFAAQYSEHLQSVKNKVAAHGLPFGVIDTVAPVDIQLQALLGGAP